MSMIEIVAAQRLQARKARNAIDAGILTTLTGELETQAKKTGNPITDDLVIACAKKLIKSNTETIKLMPECDLQNGLIRENEVLTALLPAQLTEQEIRRIITEQNLQGVPAVMKYLGSNYSGQFDKALASSIAKSA